MLSEALDGIELKQVEAVQPHTVHATYSPPSDTSPGRKKPEGDALKWIDLWIMLAITE